MKKTLLVLIICSPLVLFFELALFGWITELLRQPSDVAVFAGILLICFTIAANFYLINFIKTTLNKKQ